MTLRKKGCKIIIITGDCGVGKSAIFPILKTLLSPNSFDIHEMDEVGVPDEPTLDWRKKTTFYWLNLALKNLDTGKSSIILGMIDPRDVERYCVDMAFERIFFIHLDVSKSERLHRLKMRREKRAILMQHHQNLFDLRSWFKLTPFPYDSINTTNLGIKECAEEVYQIIIHQTNSN